MGCRSSAATSAPTPPPACSPSDWQTKSDSSRSWTSAPTPSSSSATGTASWPRRARPVRRSRAAPSPAACPASTAPSRMSTLNDAGAFTLGVIGGGRAGGHLRLGPRRSDERAAAHRPDERHGAIRRWRVAHRRSTRRTTSISSRATSTSWRRPRAPTSPACTSSSATTASLSTTSTCSTSPGGFGRHLKKDASRRIGLIPNLPDDKIVQVGQRCHRRRVHRAAVGRAARGARSAGATESSTAGSKRIRTSSTSSSKDVSSSRSSRRTRCAR